MGEGPPPVPGSREGTDPAVSRRLLPFSLRVEGVGRSWRSPVGEGSACPVVIGCEGGGRSGVSQLKVSRGSAISLEAQSPGGTGYGNARESQETSGAG